MIKTLLEQIDKHSLEVVLEWFVPENGHSYSNHIYNQNFGRATEELYEYNCRMMRIHRALNARQHTLEWRIEKIKQIIERDPDSEIVLTDIIKQNESL